MSTEANDQKNLLAVNLSLAANVVLAALKTSVGILGHSPALLADGIMSTSDVVYLVIVRVFMRLAGKPPDAEHPYGHRQLESIAAVVVGAFVMTTGVAIFWNAINQVFDWLIDPEQGRSAKPVALWVALLMVVCKVWLAVFTGRIARQTKSITVLALARDHRNDIFSISTATIGIALGQAGYLWVDPFAAALVAMVIFYTGVTILRESSANLMDILPGEPVRRRIRGLVEGVPGVEQVEEIQVHQIGYYLLVEVTIGVDGSMSVAEGDRIATRVERMLKQNIEYLRRISVHYHPSRTFRVDDPPE
ncbi:MAG TPA: cation diffusion facilitator family transporter [Thermoguttaceae bacterium]|nr:cation diffusion facilitator family transporter [Thermoguttaceae bacterium]